MADAEEPTLPEPPTDRRRVKVYELRQADWYDRGTGFCTAAYVPIPINIGRSHIIHDDAAREPRIIVESEDHPDRTLLEVRILKEDQFNQQQETLIVWTEPTTGVDMALSFQEAEGCDTIWNFVNAVQKTIHATHDDSLSDDLVLDNIIAHTLPSPELSTLPELEENIRSMATSNTGRDALAKCIISEDYISRLIPLVEIAEDLEGLEELHRLCNIMKIILMLNDTAIIEHAVSDECIQGVVGALEYDPDFPSHKANHRQWLSQRSKYIEVIKLEDEQIQRKIHQTHRLMYLRDVVLARILDDPTFSVLNSLVFFNQVDIISHLLSKPELLNDLFSIFTNPTVGPIRKKEAVLYIQQCCSIAKNLQPPVRQGLYTNFLNHGLLQVINFGLRQPDVAARVGATDILVSMMEHDPQMIRQTIYRQLREGQQPLTDTLMELLMAEFDLGIKSQISEALKVLLDSMLPSAENTNKQNGEGNPRRAQPLPPIEPQQDMFLQHFYDNSAAKLFKPLLDLEGKTDLSFSVTSDGGFSYLTDIICFYLRQHYQRIKLFVLQQNIAQRFLQLLTCRYKHLQLVAIRFFRQLIILKDQFWVEQVIEKQVLGPLLDVLIRTLPRDNLLCSACLDLFALIQQETIKDLVNHLVEKHKDKLLSLAYIPLFKDLLDMHERLQRYEETYFLESEDEVVVNRPTNANTRGMMEQLPTDPDEEAFWNGSDDEEELQTRAGPPRLLTANGADADSTKALVDYASDEDGDDSSLAPKLSMEGGADSAAESNSHDEAVVSTSSPVEVAPPIERVSEKRRREEDEEDEIEKLLQTNKRRNSGSGSLTPSPGSAAGAPRRSRSLTGRDSPANGNKKIAISISPTLKLAATGQGAGVSEDRVE